MTTLFRLDTSIRTDGSVSRAVADTLQGRLLDELGDVTVVRRDLGVAPLPGDAWTHAVQGAFSGSPSAQQQEAAAVATTLADEVADADAVIVASPLYNFGVSQQAKLWIDLLITDPRFGPGTTPLAGRPGFLVVAKGGGYAPGTPREGWDHGTGYLQRILADVWGLDLQVVEAELTLAETTPAMAELRDLARQNLDDAHVAARSAADQVTARFVGAV